MITEQQKNIYTSYVKNGISFDDFVKKINEIYFNLEPEAYDEKHPEIKKFEVERWDGIAKKFFKSDKSLRVLDLGCGSGFVADHVCQHLKREDIFTFADISGEMLVYCENRFKNKFQCSLEFKKLISDTLDFPNEKFDLVTMNSVLHHIPDTEKVLREVDRVLKKGGKLIIAHEVNRDFFRNKILWTNYRLLRLFSKRGALVESIFKHAGLTGFYGRNFKKSGLSYYDELYDRVNKELLEEKMITKPLSPSKMGLLLETYSSIGFDVDQLAKCTPSLALVEKKTYNHLNDNPTFWLSKLYEKMLAKIFPNSGKSFIAIFQKNKLIYENWRKE